MATIIFYINDLDNDTVCNPVSGNDRDLGEEKDPAGDNIRLFSSSPHTEFSEVGVNDINVSNYIIPIGSSSYTTEVNWHTSIGSPELRWRIQAIDSSCNVTASSPYSATYSGTGTFSETLALDWAAGDNRLRISFEVRNTVKEMASVQVFISGGSDLSKITAPFGGTTYGIVSSTEPDELDFYAKNKQVCRITSA